MLSALYRHPRLFRSRRAAEKWIRLTEEASLVTDVKNERCFTRADLQTISAPLLLLVGQRSSTLPSARRLAALCPHAILREVPNVGHFFPISHPRLFVRPALRFLRAVNKRSAGLS